MMNQREDLHEHIYRQEYHHPPNYSTCSSSISSWSRSTENVEVTSRLENVQLHRIFVLPMWCKRIRILCSKLEIIPYPCVQLSLVQILCMQMRQHQVPAPDLFQVYSYP
ncbi:unnamed protein product [Amoebophrya sp. A25]|nr:unnamed protein product [Amoebophrya sp. A25]|eukprot:GSA25T00012891001.1